MSEEVTPKDVAQGGKPDFTPPATQEELNAIIAERVKRERAKFDGFDEIKAKAAKFDELEAQNKSELEKLQDQLSEAQKRAGEAESKMLVERIARTHGISDEDDLALLGTGSAEELERRAKRIAVLNSQREPEPQKRELHVPGEGRSPDPALNSDELLSKLKNAVGAN